MFSAVTASVRTAAFCMWCRRGPLIRKRQRFKFVCLWTSNMTSRSPILWRVLTAYLDVPVKNTGRAPPHRPVCRDGVGACRGTKTVSAPRPVSAGLSCTDIVWSWIGLARLRIISYGHCSRFSLYRTIRLSTRSGTCYPLSYRPSVRLLRVRPVSQTLRVFL